MKLHPGRILGIILGLAILAAVFLLPFGTETLYGMAGPLLGNIGGVQATGTGAEISYGYVLIIAFILLVIAGVVGLFPLGTGVLGVVAMAMLSLAPSLIFPNGSVKLVTGAGFFVIWAASIISLGASFWHGKKEQAAGTQPTMSVSVTQKVGTETTTSPTLSRTCPNCGTKNPVDAITCSECGLDVSKVNPS